MFNLFIYCYQVMLLCITKGNVVTALSSLIRNPYLLLPKAKYINEGHKENNTLFGGMNEWNTSYERGNGSLYIYETGLAYYYLEDNVLNLNATEQKMRSYSQKLENTNSKRFLKDDTTTKLKVQRFLESIRIWFFLYIALAIPLWCTRGWCCCCLLCKTFKPNKIINEAKIFLESNPPGVLKHRGGVIYYEPSEKEKDCFDRLEHVIRTI